MTEKIWRIILKKTIYSYADIKANNKKEAFKLLEEGESTLWENLEIDEFMFPSEDWKLKSIHKKKCGGEQNVFKK